MRIAGIVRDSIVDGEGVRDVIFLQGCNHYCRGCHNPHTWDASGGTEYTLGQILEEIEDSSNDVTISGGEPINQWFGLIVLLDAIRRRNKRIWLYTGNNVSPTDIKWIYLSKFVDVVVDGEYVEELNNKDLLFRGSSNQRIIDLPKSVQAQEIVLWEGLVNETE